MKSWCKSWSCGFIVVGSYPAVWGSHASTGMAQLVALLLSLEAMGEGRHEGFWEDEEEDASMPEAWSCREHVP